MRPSINLNFALGWARGIMSGWEGWINTVVVHTSWNKAFHFYIYHTFHSEFEISNTFNQVHILVSEENPLFCSREQSLQRTDVHFSVGTGLLLDLHAPFLSSMQWEASDILHIYDEELSFWDVFVWVHVFHSQLTWLTLREKQKRTDANICSYRKYRKREVRSTGSRCTASSFASATVK